MIQAVIFDLDGTLVDSVDFHATAWQKAFAEFGKKFSFEEIRAQIGKGGDELLPNFLTDREVHSFGEDLKKYLHLPAIGVLCGGFKPGTLREAGVSKLYKDPADLLVNYPQSPICA